VYHQLARLQAAPANTDQAIATLRKSLDENLANEAKMRAQMDKLRSQWEQRSNQPKP
jgi:flagellar biosynthesis chaperone FliJ